MNRHLFKAMLAGEAPPAMPPQRRKHKDVMVALGIDPAAPRRASKPKAPPAKPKARIGRPPLGEDAMVVVPFRLRPAERAVCVEAAAREGLRLSEWLRGIALRAAGRSERAARE